MLQNNSLFFYGLWVTFCVALNCFTSMGQDYDQDINRIMSKIGETEELAIKAEVNVYSRKGGDKIYSVTSSVKYSKAGMCTKTGDTEIYKSSSYEIHVDHLNKTVFIHKTHIYDEKDFSKKSLNELKKYFEQEMKDTPLNNPVKKLVSTTDGLRTYRISNMTGYKEMSISLDVTNLKLKEITYLFTENSPQKGQYCVVNYSDFNYNPNFGSNELNSSYYFSVVGGNYKLTDRFKNYKLLQE